MNVLLHSHLFSRKTTTYPSPNFVDDKLESLTNEITVPRTSNPTYLLDIRTKDSFIITTVQCQRNI